MEICKDRVHVRTIDGAQGAEADFVITAFINTDGGFLWQPERVIVALTRPKYGAVDIMAKNLGKSEAPDGYISAH